MFSQLHNCKHFDWTAALQAVDAVVGQGPLDASAANAVAALEALKQLPSQQAGVLEHVEQTNSQASGQKQQAQPALIDAQADLQECLAEAQAEGSSISQALQACLLAAASEHNVGIAVPSRHLPINLYIIRNQHTLAALLALAMQLCNSSLLRHLTACHEGCMI